MTLRTFAPSAVGPFSECSRIYDFSYNEAIYPTASTAVHIGVESFIDALSLWMPSW